MGEFYARRGGFLFRFLWVLQDVLDQVWEAFWWYWEDEEEAP